MILSLRWIFDHIDADWNSVDVNTIVERFNKVTAEIESFEHHKLDIAPYFVAVVQSISHDSVIVSIPETRETHTLQLRDDLPDQPNESVGFVIFKENDSFRWATVKDWGLDKDGLLPAFAVDADLAQGGWRAHIETEDILFDVDNKSITHRPDMWGHRGFAREIAAYMDLPFKSESEFLQQRDVTYFDGASVAAGNNSFVIKNEAPQACNQFAGLYCSSASNVPAHFFVAMRLLKVGTRTINGIVDLTNYLMFDWSQPTHAYDADKISGSTLIARMAKPGEKLALLDGSEIELDDQDLLISDPKKSLALAGIMGGIHDSISDTTTTLFLESAHFDAGFVRKTAARHHVRTESSARYEKTLDPAQATVGIKRFLALAQQFGVALKPEGNIICVGNEPQPLIINLSHTFLEQRSGVILTPDQVIEILTKREFGVKLIKGDTGTEYEITVPSFRSAKDVTIKQDILEEVVRCYGFDKVLLEIPRIQKQSSDLTSLFRLRKIKSYFAGAARMTEQQNYALFDDTFLEQINWQPPQTPTIINPVSSEQSKMVTSLVPHLLHNITENINDADALRYFETARVWSLENKEVVEQKCFSGIFFEKRKSVDFYECKALLQGLFDSFRLTITWQKMEENQPAWCNPHQTAQIVLDGNVIGYAGSMSQHYCAPLGLLSESTAFIFELNGDAILAAQPEKTKYEMRGKYQGATFDLSFMMPLTVSTAQLEEKLSALDDLVTDVRLVDFFEKAEWVDKRSLAFRVWLENPEKTLTKDEIEDVRLRAISTLEAVGGVLRDGHGVASSGRRSC